MVLVPKVYSEQLASKSYGLPLWIPESTSNDFQPEIGDVGHVLDGAFHRLFNATRSPDHPINANGVPEGFELLKFNRRLKKSTTIPRGPICSKTVESHLDEGSTNVEGADVNHAYKFTCLADQGAVLVLNEPATREYILPNRHFVEYMRFNHENWHKFAQSKGVQINKEDIILISGLVKSSSWALAAFTENGQSQQLSFGSAGFSVPEGSAILTRTSPPRAAGSAKGKEKATSSPEQTVFLTHYKMKYRHPDVPLRKRKGAAQASEDQQEKQNDDDDDEKKEGQEQSSDDQGETENGIAPSQIAEIPGLPAVVELPEVTITLSETSYNDPLDQLLVYILNSCDADVAIACDDDLNELGTGDWPQDIIQYLKGVAPLIENDTDRTGYRSLEAYVITERRATEDRAAIEASDLEHDRNEVRQRLQREAQKEREEVEKQEAEARRIAESEGQEAMPGVEPAAQQQNAAEPQAPTPPAENAIVEAPEAAASPMIVDSTPEPPAPPPAEAEAPTESATIPTTEETSPIVVDGTTDTVNTDQSVVRTATMSPTPSGRGSPSERKVPPPNDDFSLERIISDLKGGAAILGKDALSGRSIDWPHRVLFDPRAEGGAVCGFDISKDSQLVVGGYEDAKIRIWGYQFGDMIYLLKDHQDSVWTTKLSPDGTRLASGGADNKILLWDLTTGVNATVIRELVGHKQDVWIIAYSPTGKTLASGSVDTTVRIWDVETGDCLVTMGDHLTVILELSYNQDGSKLLSTSDMDAIIYDDSGNRLVDMKGHTGVIWCLQWSPDGRRVLSGSEDHTARVWSAETGEELVIIGEHSGPVWGAAFSPDGKKVVTGSYDSSVVVSDSFSAERIFQLRDRAAIINCVGFSRDGEFVVAGSANGSVKIWDAIDGEFIGELQGHKDKVKLVAFTADDNYIVSASDDGSVRFWSLVDILRL